MQAQGGGQSRARVAVEPILPCGDGEAQALDGVNGRGVQWTMAATTDTGRCVSPQRLASLRDSISRALGWQRARHG